MADSSGSKAMMFVGGVVLGGAVAFGAAYGAARYYVGQLETQASAKRRSYASRDRDPSPAARTLSVTAAGPEKQRSTQRSPSPSVASMPLHRLAATSQLANGQGPQPPAPLPIQLPANGLVQTAGVDIVTNPITIPARSKGQDNELDYQTQAAMSPRLAYLSRQIDMPDVNTFANGNVHGEAQQARRPADSSLSNSVHGGVNGTANGGPGSGGGKGASGAAPLPPAMREREYHAPPVPALYLSAADRGGTSKAQGELRKSAELATKGSVARPPTGLSGGSNPAGGMPRAGSNTNLQHLAAAAAAHGLDSALHGLGPHLLTEPTKTHTTTTLFGASPSDVVALSPPTSLGEDYARVITPEPPLTEEMEEVCALLAECLDLRKKWRFEPVLGMEQRRSGRNWAEPEAAKPSDINPEPLAYRPIPASAHRYRMRDGVMQVFLPDQPDVNLFPVSGTASDFFTDMHRILRYSALGPVKSYCHHRLMLLEQKFNLHLMLNSDKEFLAQKAAPHRDFYNVRKVDTHVHHSACMHQKHLLRFIKSKLRKEPDEVVIFRDGKYLTLREVFESLKMTGYDLNVDTLDMHADKNTFHRFDKFNLKYNPCGQSRLREIFIKQDNLIHGRFLAELTREVFSDLEASKYQHAELRISIYGRKAMEWDILASWVVAHNLYSDNNVWLIQIPRLYNIYKDTGVIDNFQQLLDNIFEPLFEVTADPSTHPQLHVFLSQVVGFDMVDDESKPERRPTKHSPAPSDWNSKHNCAYAYYAYYIYANLFVLNKFRESRGLNPFVFRPHAGEAGDIDHLVCAFMLCENIAHGINLRKSPCLQYLFYLSQIGLCMSPLSNNSLFLDYHRNPFPTFFARGLSVSLSTDDPLQIHLTKEPLVEEYSVAAQVWKLSSADLCEVARNGVLHSGFPHACKKHWVAEEYWRPGPEGNDIHKTNVPNVRLRFRHDTYYDEVRLMLHGLHNWQAKKALMPAKE